MKNIFLFTVLFISGLPVTNAQWSQDSLSAPAWGLVSVQNGSKATFASSVKYETYDFANGTWSVKNMSQPRANVKGATAGGKSYFGGGGFIGQFSYAFYKNVDIYDTSTNAWTTASLSQARMVGAAAGIGNKVLFAGGRVILNYSSKVDIFDVSTGTKTTATLSQGRHNMAVGIAAGKVVFAGGETGNISNGVYTSSNKVDIYDAATGTWSMAVLSAKREQLSVGVVGNKILFAGGSYNGVYSKKVDIYDALNNTWTTASMSQPKYGMSVATYGDKVYFAGGTTSNSGALSKRVEIYNSTTNSWSYVTLSTGRYGMCAGQTPARLMFAGGVTVWGNTGSDRVEVLDLATGSWSVEHLSSPRLYLASASYGTQVLFAGGAEVLSGYPQYSIISNRVDSWTDLVAPRLEGNSLADSKSKNNSAAFSIYPNPASGQTVNLDFGDADPLPATIHLYDAIGKEVSVQVRQAGKEAVQRMDISGLKSGSYFIAFQDKVSGNMQTKKLIVHHE